MKEISKLLDYRPDIKVIDATLRDGGLVNDFFFSDEFVKALYTANLRSGVDYMEFGYKADRELFDEEKFGIESDAAGTAESIQEGTSFLPDYAFKGSDSPVGTSFSGIVGSVMVAGVAALICIAGGYFRKNRKTTHEQNG